MRQRIVLVRVTAHATDRQAEPDGADRLGPIERGGDAEFLLIDTALLVGQRLPIERGGDLLPDGRVR